VIVATRAVFVIEFMLSWLIGSFSDEGGKLITALTCKQKKMIRSHQHEAHKGMVTLAMIID